MRNLLSFLSLVIILALSGCAARAPATRDANFPERDLTDPVWSSYYFRGPMPRAYFHARGRGWISTGAAVTPEDIAKAPCRVVLGRYKTSCYDSRDDTIYLDERDRVTVLWHEIQHCADMRNGMTDVRELERRAMIAEMGGVP